jgi:flagellar secretion chaperone FliS
LVCLLYAKAAEKLALAQRLNDASAVRARAEAIARAAEIVLELQGSLDRERGGEIAVELARLYEYIQTRLAAGLAERTNEPLAEAARLLETLSEGWRECRRELTSLSATETPAPSRAPLEAAEGELALAGASRVWTL